RLDGEPVKVGALGACSALPNLKHLLLENTQLMEAVVAGAVWVRLESLRVRHDYTADQRLMADWLESFNGRGPGPAVVSVDYNGRPPGYGRYCAEFHRAKDGTYVGPIDGTPDDWRE
ncbi:MAG: hypothetical protein JRH20_21315, partial [Deltaproteobacteria bacterium]|nr:hypothetical protein [Deltaproteobacteria bacterium]